MDNHQKEINHAGAQSRAGEAGANLTDVLAATVERDAARYRWLRDNKYLDMWWSVAGSNDRCRNIDADIDAVMKEAANVEVRGRPPTETTNGDKDHD